MTHVISMRHEHELRVTTDMLLSIKVLQTSHLHRQKRPTIETKETYYRDKRDLL
jgi:hypothetical protein